MFKLLKILKERTITYDELFRMCDTNVDGDLSLSEMINCLTGLSDDFYQKECQAINNFFDVDRSGSFNEDEFLG